MGRASRAVRGSSLAGCSPHSPFATPGRSVDHRRSLGAPQGRPRPTQGARGDSFASAQPRSRRVRDSPCQVARRSRSTCRLERPHADAKGPAIVAVGATRRLGGDPLERDRRDGPARLLRVFREFGSRRDVLLPQPIVLDSALLLRPRREDFPACLDLDDRVGQEVVGPRRDGEDNR